MSCGAMWPARCGVGDGIKAAHVNTIGEPDVVDRVLDCVQARARREHPAGEDAADLAVERDLVDLDEGLQEWRYRHVKMVERTIGHKMGSGGSSGVGYLASTLFRPVFPDLWAIRARC